MPFNNFKILKALRLSVVALILLITALGLNAPSASPAAQSEDSQPASPAESKTEIKNEAAAQAPVKPKTDPELERIWKIEDGAADLYQAGQQAQAEAAYLRCLAEYEAKFGPDHRGAGRVLFNLGLIQVDRHFYARAEPYYLRSLAIRQKVLGAVHPRVAAVHQELGYIYLIQKKDEPSAKHYEAAAAIHEAGLFKNDKGAATYLLALSKEFEAQRITYYALQLGRAMDLALPLVGINKNDQPVDLAGARQRLAKTVAAEARTTRLLNGYLKTVKPATRGLLNQLAAVFHGLGIACINLNQSGRAAVNLEQALMIYGVLVGAAHEQATRVGDDLRQAYLNEGRLVDARYLKIRQQINLSGRGVGVVDGFSLRDAEAALRQSLAKREKKHGKNHSKLVGALRLLAAVVQEQGRISEADEISQRADKIKAKAALKQKHKRPNRPVSTGSRSGSSTNYSSSDQDR